MTAKREYILTQNYMEDVVTKCEKKISLLAVTYLENVRTTYENHIMNLHVQLQSDKYFRENR